MHRQRVDRSNTSSRTVGEPGSAGTVEPAFPRAGSPSRRELIEEFCRAVGWRDAQGRLSVSSASVALRRLEKEGQVQLPPMAPRSQSARPRGLSDDGRPLPVLPHFTAGGRDMTGLKLRLIQDEHDPAHPIWNRLIVREHPLGRSPLVGAQLRYLVECDQGILGSFWLWACGVSLGMSGSVDWLEGPGPPAEPV